MLNGSASSFIIITLSEISQNPIIDFATLFFITIPTQFLCFSPPEYIIVCISCIIFPSSVQCVSAIPRMSRFTFCISCIRFLNLPGWYKVLRFHVHIFRHLSLVFRKALSEDDLPGGFESFSSSADQLETGASSLWLLSGSIARVST